VVFYWVLFVNLRTYHVKWRMMDWDVVGADGLRAHDMLNNMTNWSAYYGYGRPSAVCMRCTGLFRMTLCKCNAVGCSVCGLEWSLCMV
jgi:hypothetical protein